MTKVPSTATTKDWLGDGMIMPYPIPTETQTLPSHSESGEVSPDVEEMRREVSDEEQEELCAVC